MPRRAQSGAIAARLPSGERSALTAVERTRRHARRGLRLAEHALFLAMLGDFLVMAGSFSVRLLP